MLAVDRFTPSIEDVNHGNLDIDFALACHQTGIVFDRTDMQRFAMTFLRRIWNGGYSDARLRNRVDGTGPAALSSLKSIGWWIGLAEFDLEVLSVSRTTCGRNWQDLVCTKDPSPTARPVTWRWGLRRLPGASNRHGCRSVASCGACRLGLLCVCC